MIKKNSVFDKVGLYVVFASLLLVSLLIQSCSTTAPKVVGEELTSTIAPQTNADQLSPAADSTKVPGNELLEKAFQRQKKAVENIGKQIERSADLREKAQVNINELKSEGREVEVLDNLLKKFDETIAGIKAKYQKIQETLSAHKGFDEAGKVINAKLGWETTKSLTEDVRKIQFEFRRIRRVITLKILHFRQIEKTPMPS